VVTGEQIEEEKKRKEKQNYVAAASHYAFMSKKVQWA
jgi:hypothetical protein